MRTGTYVRIGDRDEPTLVEPLDYLILEELQDEGEMMGGYFPLATTVSHLSKRKFPQLTSNVIGARLRTLNQLDLVVRVNLGTDRGWQRTKAGKEVFEKWQQQK